MIVSPPIKLLIILWIFFPILSWAELRDPTRPNHYRITDNKNDVSKGIVLNAIYYHSSNKAAMLNGEMLHENNEINGYRLIHIDKQAVTLQGPAGVIELKLFPEVVKKTISNQAR